MLNRRWLLDYVQENKNIIVGRTSPKVLATKANRRARLKNAMPKWVNKKDVEYIYKKTVEKSLRYGKPYHVDHIIPLCGKYVSGLHVPWNLRIISAQENMKKSNKVF